MIATASPASRRLTSGTYLAGLVWTLVRTDFKTRYHGTIQGFVWALLKPIAMFLVLMSVFSFVFAQESAYRLNLIIGLFLWDFFFLAGRPVAALPGERLAAARPTA